MKIFRFRIKKTNLVLQTETVWADGVFHNTGHRYLGFFTSRVINHKWVSKGEDTKYYTVDTNFGVNLIWGKIWITISNRKEYNYSVKFKKNKSEINWDI
jgi:hypothetical protein